MILTSETFKIHPEFDAVQPIKWGFDTNTLNPLGGEFFELKRRHLKNSS